MGRIKKLMLTVMVAATFLPLTLASPVDAAVCTRRTGVHHDDSDGGIYKRVWTEDSVCGNDAGAPIYAGPSRTTQIAVMDTTSSWFVCYVEGAQHEGGNNIWYYTQGDRVVSNPEFNRWGFMPAVHVHTTNDPGDSRLPPC
jgi:hypothetical protein